MSKSKSNYSSKRARSPRRLSVREVRRETPDLETIALTVEALALAQAEKEAAEAAQRLREGRS